MANHSDNDKFHRVACEACGKSIDWFGHPMDRPACPRCNGEKKATLETMLDRRGVAVNE